MARSRGKRKKPFFLRRNVIILFIVIFIVIGIWLFIRDVDKQEFSENREINQEVVDGMYRNLENLDSVSYKANIMVEETTSILQLSKKFYGDEVFWPYIFIVNTDIENILDIQPGTIIKIPHVSPHLINKSYKESIVRAELLADSLLNDVQLKRKKALETQMFEDW